MCYAYFEVMSDTFSMYMNIHVHVYTTLAYKVVIEEEEPRTNTPQPSSTNKQTNKVSALENWDTHTVYVHSKWSLRFANNLCMATNLNYIPCTTVILLVLPPAPSILILLYLHLKFQNTHKSA